MWKLCFFSKSHGPGAQRMTVRSADEETKVRSCGCHLHWITLSQCSPATVWGRGLVRSPGVKERGKFHTGEAYKHNFKRFKIWFFTSNNDLFQATLKVADYDPVVIGTSEEMMGSRWEAHRAYVTAVGAVRLHYSASSNVVQHASAVLLTGGEQAAAGIHCHWSNCTSWVTYSVKNVMLLDAA